MVLKTDRDAPWAGVAPAGGAQRLGSQGVIRASRLHRAALLAPRRSMSRPGRLGAAALSAAVMFASPAAHAGSAPAGMAAPTVQTTQRTQAIQAGDPYEGINRAIFRFNHGLDRLVIRPVAVGYHRIVPGPLRTALHNIVANLGEPAVAINDLLQGHGVRATRTAARFAANSTLGLAGIFDVASRASLPHHTNDFGVTLAKYGARPGPYLVLPLVGPSTVRDAAGRLVDLALNPLNYAGYPGAADVGTGAAVEGGLDTRAAVDSDLRAVYATATDPYAYLRSLYLQNRQSEVTGGRVDVEQLPAFDDLPADTPSAASPAPAVGSAAETAASASAQDSSARAAPGMAAPAMAAPGAAAPPTDAAAPAGPIEASALQRAPGALPNVAPEPVQPKDAPPGAGAGAAVALAGPPPLDVSTGAAPAVQPVSDTQMATP